MLAAQVALLEGIALDAARQRLTALTRAGFLTSEQRYVADPRAYTVTREGRGVAGSDLSQPRKLDPALYAHDVGVTWLTAAARRGLFGELSQVVSERRMRSEDGREDRSPDEPGRELHGVRYLGGGAGVPRHLIVADDVIKLVGRVDRRQVIGREPAETAVQPMHSERVARCRHFDALTRALRYRA